MASIIQFRLRSLLLMVVPIAIAAAALRDASRAWDCAIITLTLTSVFTAIIAARFGNPGRRPGWNAFAICCGLYLLVAESPYVVEFPRDMRETVVSALLPERADELLLDNLHPGSEFPYRRPFVTSQASPGSNISRQAQTAATVVPSQPAITCNGISLALAMVALTSEIDEPTPPQPENGPGPADATPATSTPDTNALEKQLEHDSMLGMRFMQIARCFWALTIGAATAASATHLSRRHGLIAGRSPLLVESDKKHDLHGPPAKKLFLLLRRVGPAIALLALTWIALANSNSTWACVAATSAAAAIPLAAIIPAVFGSRGARPFWSGMAICGGGYFLLALTTSSSMGTNPISGVETAATTESLRFLHDKLFPDSTVKLGPDDDKTTIESRPLPVVGLNEMKPLQESLNGAIPDTVSLGDRPTRLCQVTLVNEETDTSVAVNFITIGQSAWTLLFGWCGGLFAQFLSRRCRAA